MRVWAMLIGLVLLSVTSITFADSPETPGLHLYDKIQDIRDQARALYGSGHATRDQLHRAETMLEGALGDLGSDDAHELAYGNEYLAYRRFDVNRDLAVVYAEAGDKQKALDAMEGVESVSWAPEYLDDLKNPVFDGLRDEPRFKAIVANLQLAARLMGNVTLATPYSAELSDAQRLAGLSLFWSTAKYGFAHFDHVPNLDWDQAYLDYIPKVLAAKNTREYYDVLMRFAPLLHDGHTNVYPPDELKDAFYVRPPLRTELLNGHVLIWRVDSPSLGKLGLKVGDEIVAVNGDDVRHYAETYVAPYQSSSTPQDLAVRMYDYDLLRGDKKEPIRLKIKGNSGSDKEVTVSRGDYTDAVVPKQFEVRQLPGNIAYISLDSFESDASVKAFEQYLPQIMHAKGLVIDMRMNHGGDGSYGMAILSHLTHAPIPMARVRIPIYSAYGQAALGPRIDWEPEAADDEVYRNEQKVVYDGPVAVLIGPRTFSAGEDFVLSFDLLHRGLLVGESTGGSTGQPLMFKLPGGGSARVCVKRDSYPDGREFVGVGINPNVSVSPTSEDIRAGRDLVLARATDELLKH